jgi:hypothetical protein
MQSQQEQQGFFPPKKNNIKNIRQSSLNMFEIKNHYEEKGTTTDEFNVWGDSPPVSHNVRVTEHYAYSVLKLALLESKICRRVQ